MAALQVLLVEDDPEDTRLILEELEGGSTSLQLHVVTTDDAAISYLNNLHPHEDAAHPSLILLGMQPPRLSGNAVLQAIQRSPMLRQIPVVVLTRSRKIADMLNSYDLHANSCVLKPTTEVDFRRAIRAIRRFWLDLVVLPLHDGHR